MGHRPAPIPDSFYLVVLGSLAARAAWGDAMLFRHNAPEWAFWSCLWFGGVGIVLVLMAIYYEMRGS